MAVNLVKGQKVDLRKSDGGTLRHVMVGLGWDEAERNTSGGFLSGIFGGKKKHNIDCDASVFVCRNGKLTSDPEDIVYFGHLEHNSGAVRHMGDNLTGAGEGDDEQVYVDLDKLPSGCDRIIFVVNIYKARERSQHFGTIRNAFIRICDNDNRQELLRYNLSENYEGMTAMVFGEIYRRNGQWKFSAVGQATTDNTIDELAQRFM